MTSGWNHSWREGAQTSRKWLLRAFLASIGVNAALGVWALLFGDFDQTEAKVLATSLLVSAAMLSVLVNGAPIQRRVLWPVPVVAAGTAAASFLLVIGLMWAEVDREAPVKLVFSGLIVAAGATLAGLLALITLAPRHRPVRAVDLGLIALVVALGLWGLWGELDVSWYGRLLGVVSVLLAAVTLAIPVLARFGVAAEATTPGPRPGPGGDEAVTPATAAGDRPAASETVRHEGPTLGDLVSSPMVVVEEMASLRTVVDRLAEAGATFAVVGDSHRVAGVISAADILGAIHDGADLDLVWAADVMTVDVLAAQAGDPVPEGARLMTDNGIRQLLVLGDGGGVVTITDVLASMAALDGHPVAGSRRHP